MFSELYFVLESDYSFRSDAASAILIYQGAIQWNVVGTFQTLSSSLIPESVNEIFYACHVKLRSSNTEHIANKLDNQSYRYTIWQSLPWIYIGHAVRLEEWQLITHKFGAGVA